MLYGELIKSVPYLVPVVWTGVPIRLVFLQFCAGTTHSLSDSIKSGICLYYLHISGSCTLLLTQLYASNMYFIIRAVLCPKYTLYPPHSFDVRTCFSSIIHTSFPSITHAVSHHALCFYVSDTRCMRRTDHPHEKFFHCPFQEGFT